MIPSCKKLQFYSPNVQTDVWNWNHRLCCYWPLLSASHMYVCTLLPILCLPYSPPLPFRRLKDAVHSKGRFKYFVQVQGFPEFTGKFNSGNTHTHTHGNQYSFPRWPRSIEHSPLKEKNENEKQDVTLGFRLTVHRWSLTDRFWMN